MMHRGEGLAEELSRLFYNKSGPSLRAVQRRISQPGVWWKFANILGLILGGLMIVSSGLVPWWEVGSHEANGLDFMRGRAAFSLGAVLLLMGFLRALGQLDRFRLAAVPMGALLALVVIGLAILERSQYTNFSWEFPTNMLSGRHSFADPAVREGLMLTIYGGIIAFFGSLCGLAPDSDSAADPPSRSARYAR